MLAYRAPLRRAGFRRLWYGAVVSLLGDGATWVALAWLAVTMGGTDGLVTVTVAYTLPVIAGGIAVGPILDRFERRTVLVWDSAVRGLAVASVPAAAALGRLTLAQLAITAALYGLLKIVPLAAVPASLPDLVPAGELQAASALESVAYGIGGLVGPAVGGLLIPFIGAANVLGADALSYAYFALMVAWVPWPAASAATRGSRGWAPAIRFVVQDRPVLALTAAFMAFNIASGMLLVVEPWLARYELSQGARTLGLLLATVAMGELLGSLLAGATRPGRRLLVRIGTVQTLAGLAFLCLLGAPRIAPVLLGTFLIGLLSSPLTVMAQVVRLQRTPAHLRGRTLALVRTLMQGAIPIGSALAGPPLAGRHYALMVIAMAVVASAPGGLLVVWSAASPTARRV